MKLFVGPVLSVPGSDASVKWICEGGVKWWDHLGVGGQGLVIAGGIAIVLGVGLLLLPELVLGVGLGLAGGGMLGTTSVVPTGVGIVRRSRSDRGRCDRCRHRIRGWRG
jgi:hypothetical protein